LPSPAAFHLSTRSLPFSASQEKLCIWEALQFTISIHQSTLTNPNPLFCIFNSNSPQQQSNLSPPLTAINKPTMEVLFHRCPLLTELPTANAINHHKPINLCIHDANHNQIPHSPCTTPSQKPSMTYHCPN
jgi:hypothetical protein